MQNFRRLAQKLWIGTPPPLRGDGICTSPFIRLLVSSSLLKKSIFLTTELRISPDIRQFYQNIRNLANSC